MPSVAFSAADDSWPERQYMSSVAFQESDDSDEEEYDDDDDEDEYDETDEYIDGLDQRRIREGRNTRSFPLPAPLLGSSKR